MTKPVARTMRAQLQTLLIKEEEVRTLKAMAMAVLTLTALDKLAQNARKMRRWHDVSDNIGKANSRLLGKVWDHDERRLIPALYENPDTKTRVLVSAGKVVGRPGVSVYILEEEGYKFKRMVR